MRQSGGGSYERARAELRALFDEVADVDWDSPTWSGFVAVLAASEVLSKRELTPERAAESFVTALEANSGLAADTFMATHVASPPTDVSGRARLAASRAKRAADALGALDASAPEQRLLKALELRGGWLRSRPLSAERPITVAFVVRDEAYLAEVHADAPDAGLVRALEAVLEGRESGLRRVDPDATEPTPAAAAIALLPVSLPMARSFHRLAWTQAGGPWMGVADCPPYGVVSTCHAAVDGYAHARVTASILRRTPRASGAPAPRSVPAGDLAPPIVGFATRRIDGPSPRFAHAVHAFASVLDRQLGTDPTRSVPFHVPIAPGDRRESARWRRRPIYGLLALEKHDGELEGLDSLSARLPSFLRREALGRGILTRVLRAVLELPLSLSARRMLIMRQSWADRFIPPARVLTGGGYVSWMRFPQGEEPAVPTFPSAVPSFSEDRGGAGLSIAPFSGGLAVGLTTSGRLGTVSAAEAFLDEWVESLEATREGLIHSA